MTEAQRVHLAVVTEGGVATRCFAGDDARQVERQLVAYCLDEMERRLWPEAQHAVQRCLGGGDDAAAIAMFFAPGAHRWDTQAVTHHVIPLQRSPLAALSSL